MIPTASETLLSPRHAPQIEEIRHRYGHTSSSHAFNTLYIWRRFAGGLLHLEADLFTLQYKAKGPNSWLFPCGDREAAFRFISGHLSEPDFSLCYLRDGDVPWLEQRFPGQFVCSPAPGDSEYLVSCEKHRALAGGHYEKLRNKVKRAARTASITVEPLTKENLADTLHVVHDWRGNRQVSGNLALYGDEEDFEPLMMRQSLGITGIMMRADGVPAGVAAGFMLSDDTFDLFLAKVRGQDPCLGYYLRREMILTLPENVRWVNLQDDLDIDGLRTMKKQMIPEAMNEMWMAKKA